MKKKHYQVIYRTGGTDNFKWLKQLELFDNWQDAVKSARAIEIMGYKTLIHDAHYLDSIGLPETYQEGSIHWSKK